MKIVICGGLEFTAQIKKVADKLEDGGHEVFIPQTSEKILKGEVSVEEIRKEKETGAIAQRAIKQDSIRYYFDLIKKADAVLVLNLEKKNIAGYIGGNVFLEIGFAHALNKKIFLYKDIPKMHYRDEIESMKPVVIYGDLEQIK